MRRNASALRPPSFLRVPAPHCVLTIELELAVQGAAIEPEELCGELLVPLHSAHDVQHVAPLDLLERHDPIGIIGGENDPSVAGADDALRQIRLAEHVALA